MYHCFWCRRTYVVNTYNLQGRSQSMSDLSQAALEKELRIELGDHDDIEDLGDVTDDDDDGEEEELRVEVGDNEQHITMGRAVSRMNLRY